MEQQPPRKLDADDQASLPEELAGLADQLRAVPPMKPDRRWLLASKRRLLRCFDQLQGGSQPRDPNQPDR